MRRELLNEQPNNTISSPMSMYSYKAYQKYNGVEPQVIPGKSRRTLKFKREDGEENPATKDSYEEYDSPLIKAVKAARKNEPMAMSKAIDAMESGAEIDDAVNILQEVSASLVISKLKQLLSSAGESILKVGERRLREFIKDVRYDKASIRKGHIISEFSRETGLGYRLVDNMYDTVARGFRFA